MRYRPFEMERWQSTYEHRVRYNLSESGVHPLTVAELALMADGAGGLDEVRLGYGQSNGSDELRARIAALYPGATADSILVTTGGAEANFASFWHLMEPGRRAAVMLPNYMQVPRLLESFGAVPIPFHLREETDWQPDLGELEEAARGGLDFILVTNPNNPTGARLSGAAVASILDIAKGVGAWILSDEVYQGAELDGNTTASFWGTYERVLVTNSLSKAYGLPGLRIGWIVGPPAEIQSLWGRTDFTTITPATLSDSLARVALEPRVRQQILDRTRGILRGNLPVLEGWIRDQGDLFSYRAPDAGAICYVRYDADVSSSQIAETLRVEQDVLVVPGDHFGMDRYLRIGYGPPAEELREGLDRMSRAFARLRPT